MLAAIGVESMDDLLVDIPATLRIDELKLPDGLSELDTMAEMNALAAKNRVFPDRLTFRGGGVYRRFIPTAVSAVTGKPEFYSAYTPYQPEASQGTRRPDQPRSARAARRVRGRHRGRRGSTAGLAAELRRTACRVHRMSQGAGPPATWPPHRRVARLAGATRLCADPDRARATHS